MKNPKESHSYEWDALIEKIKKYGIRNVLTTTVAPTGTLINDCRLFKWNGTNICIGI